MLEEMVVLLLLMLPWSRNACLAASSVYGASSNFFFTAFNIAGLPKHKPYYKQIQETSRWEGEVICWFWHVQLPVSRTR